MNKQEICSRLPHSGAMCLIDSIVSYDDTCLKCVSYNHHHLNNPLRTAEGLSCIAGIEYAAQAMALHRSFLRPVGIVENGYLGALRNIKVHQQWLDKEDADLMTEVSLIGSSDKGAIYSFLLLIKDIEIISGRITIMSGAT
ncbi:MAG: hypothetical protein JKY93_05425 [Gammaproteobacteria bacterium]|nr:hypothetical protein [Gammaproteobacteria bacterium]